MGQSVIQCFSQLHQQECEINNNREVSVKQLLFINKTNQKETDYMERCFQYSYTIGIISTLSIISFLIMPLNLLGYKLILRKPEMF